MAALSGPESTTPAGFSYLMSIRVTSGIGRAPTRSSSAILA